jgi:large subunit ribosomal protein L23
VDIYQIIKEPHITEKASLQKDLANRVTFKVHRKANKVQIKQAVEALLKAKVLDVRTMNVRGKARRLGKSVGKRPDWKKAIVKLAPGEKIEFFEGIRVR